MRQKLFDFAKKYNFKNIVEEINILEETLELKIGFLGEFSSGKSTLINALIEQDLLTVMDVPTTKSITQIYSQKKQLENTYFKIQNDCLSEIDYIDFEDITTGRNEGIAIAKIKSNEFITDGMVIIDTPGINSMNKIDTDITFGYLPFLDGVVICQTIEKGSLPQTMLDFLLKQEIKPLIQNFIFVITNADLKPFQSVEKIHSEIIIQLKKLNTEYNLNLKNIDDMVVLTAINKKEKKIEEFRKLYFTKFIENKVNLENYRINIELLKIKKSLIIFAKDKLKNYNLSDKELIDKENELKQEKNNIENLMVSELNKLEKLKIKIKNSLDIIIQQHQHLISNTNIENINQIIENISIDISKTIEKTVEKYFSAIEIPNIFGMMSELKNKLENILKISNIGKTITTAITFAIISSGTSLIANGTEAIAAGTVNELAKEGAKEVAKKTILSKVFQIASKVITDINPIEHIGNYISHKIIENTSEKFLKNLSEQISCDVYGLIKNYLETEIFEEFYNKLNIMRFSLEEVRNEKDKSYNKNKKYLLELEADIKLLEQN